MKNTIEQDFKKDFKNLLSKYDATISILTEGEGYSTTFNIEVEFKDNNYIEFGESISKNNI